MRESINTLLRRIMSITIYGPTRIVMTVFITRSRSPDGIRVDTQPSSLFHLLWWRPNARIYWIITSPGPWGRVGIENSQSLARVSENDWTAWDWRAGLSLIGSLKGKRLQSVVREGRSPAYVNSTYLDNYFIIIFFLDKLTFKPYF